MIRTSFSQISLLYIYKYIWDNNPLKIRHLSTPPASPRQRPACLWVTLMSSNSWGTASCKAMSINKNGKVEWLYHCSKVSQNTHLVMYMCIEIWPTMPEWVCLSRMAWPYNNVRWPPPCEDLEKGGKTWIYTIQEMHKHLYASLLLHFKLQQDQFFDTLLNQRLTQH